MHADRCVCALIVPLATATRVVVVMHRREWAKTTATAHLAALALPQCEIRVRGEQGEPVQTADLLDPARRSLLLFPSEDAATLTPAFVAADPRPVTLIVPDGSWGQAAKVHKREPALAAVPRVVLPPGPPSRYRLRHEPREGGLATFEAIARALGVLEGPAAQQRLEALLLAMVEGTLATRGTL
jgi:DTW domain-containing protein YfiP